MWVSGVHAIYIKVVPTNWTEDRDVERGCEVAAGELIHTLIIACYFKVQLRKLTQATCIKIGGVHVIEVLAGCKVLY